LGADPAASGVNTKGQNRRDRYRRAGRADIRGTRRCAGTALGASIVTHALANVLPSATHRIIGGQTCNVNTKSPVPSLKQCFNE